MIISKHYKKNIIIKKCLSLLDKQLYELDTIKKENQELYDINCNLLQLVKENKIIFIIQINY